MPDKGVGTEAASTPHLPDWEVREVVSSLSRNMEGGKPEDKAAAYWDIGRLCDGLSTFCDNNWTSRWLRIQGELMRADAQLTFARLGCNIHEDKSGQMVIMAGYTTIDNLVAQAEAEKERVLHQVYEYQL